MDFSELAERFRQLESMSSRLSMTEKLAEMFSRAGKKEIGPICYLLQGRVVPLYEAVEFGVAEKFMFRAIAEAFGMDPVTVRKTFKDTGDLGTAAENLAKQARKKTKGSPSVLDVFSRLDEIARTGGEGSQDKKIGMLADLFRQSDPLSVRYLVRIPLDKLRLGFSDKTILDALSWMLSGDKSNRDQLEAAYNLRPDIGFIAGSVRAHGLKGLADVTAEPGAPILAALCQRLPNAVEMIGKMGEVAVEPKYDGVRVQIHFQKAKSSKQEADVHSYSRNLENTTAMFPELTRIQDQLNADSVILDSEAVGTDPKTGKIIPFQETVTRKRKHGIVKASEDVPLTFYVFDILYKDGRTLIGAPLSERRKILERTIGEGNILKLSPQIVTDNPDKLRDYHDTQLAAGLEGVVVKKWQSPYEPGRRGYSWVKFKEEEGQTGKLTDTIDCVVMGFYVGEGKRADFGIGAFLVGIRTDDRFVTVTKIGTGVTDEQWKELKTRLEKVKSSEKPKQYEDVDKTLTPDVWVRPEMVVEVAGDDLTKSPTHGAGIAIRFPRLVRLREDKRPDDATSLEEVRVMYENQGNGVGKRRKQKKNT